MRLIIQVSAILVVALLTGCAGNKAKFAEIPGVTDTAGKPTTNKSSNPAVVVKPNDALTGRVVSANARGRFAILNFPITRMPAIGDTLFIYREGLKVGEAKISGPQKDDNIVADVTTGEAKAGDEVREK
jgi:hypothetical protein